MMTPKVLLRRAFPFAISALALGVVLSVTDLEPLLGLQRRVQWHELPTVAVLVIAIMCAFAWRWHSLLRNELPLRRSLLVTALGLAGNQVLPLRGGDALRVVLSARGARAVSLHSAVSALAMEKIFDLIAAAAFGVASTSALISAHDSSILIAFATVTLAVAALVLIAARSGALSRMLRAAARLARVPPKLYRHVARPVQHLHHLASPGRIALLLMQTALIWMALYVFAYLAIAAFVGIPLTAADAMVLLFAAALGLAIPAAPSGLGTFHAAIVSAFALLGRSPAEGLVLAVAIHGVFLVSFCLIGAVALARAAREIGPIHLHGENG